MISSVRTIVVSGAALLVSAMLFSCTPKPAEIPLPTGPQTLTGTLVPVELSLSRRGTHIIRLQGKDTYYVESGTLNLRTYEGLDIVLRGTVEKNTDPSSLPVFVASQVTLITEPSHVWTVPALHLSFTAPIAWNGEVFDDGIIFTETGSATPLLKIHRSSLSHLPAGMPLVIGGERAVLVATGSGQVIFLENGSMVLAVSLDASLMNPSGDGPVRSVLLLLRSIGFTNASSASSGASAFSSSAVSSTGNVSTPCGGPAGILCPSGSYCAVTDTVQGIGTCRQLR